MSALWACFVLPMLPLEAHPAVAGSESGAASRAQGLVDFRDIEDAASVQVPAMARIGSTPTARAIHDGAAPRSRIVCADALANAAGIAPGLTVAQAQALLPGLRSYPRDASVEIARLEQLGALAYGFSSQVRLLPPDAVALEVGASLRLFGGWPALQRELRAQLSGLGHVHQLAAAPTSAAARIFAPLQDGLTLLSEEQLRRALARVPIAQSQLGDSAIAALERLGLRTLGDLSALNPAALARRLGRPLLDTLARLHGDAPDTTPLYQPPNRFERRFEFDYGIEHSGALLFPLQRLARDFAAFLLARDGGVLRFELLFEHEDHPPSRIEVGLRKPAREFDTLFEAVRGRLERVALPQAVDAVRWIAEDLPPFVPERFDLFDPRSRGKLDLDGLTERLRTRLGDDSVRSLSLRSEHRPERAWCAATTPPTALARGASRPAASMRDGTGTAASILPRRPLWLLPRPIPLRARIVRLCDPTAERIESGWWDGDDQRRDYFVAELDSGQRAWIFRPPGASDGWMLHGWFA